MLRNITLVKVKVNMNANKTSHPNELVKKPCKKIAYTFLTISLLAFLFLPTVYAHTIIVEPNVYFGLPQYGTYISFSTQQAFDLVYRELGYWYFDGYGFQVQNANITITNFGFANNILAYNLTGTGTSSSKIYVKEKGSPASVTGATFWNYDSPTKLLTVTATGSVTITVSWLYDTTPPTITDVTTNTTIANSACLFEAKLTDDAGLSGYIFSTNNTGSWVNDTWVGVSGTPVWAYATKTLNNTVRVRVQFRFYANDTSNNWAESEFCFLTASGEEVSIEVYQSYASETLVYVDEYVTIGFRHRFSNNQTVCTSGTSKINTIEYSINATGWAVATVSYSTEGTRTFTVTAVNVNGVTDFQMLTANITVTWMEMPVAVTPVNWFMRSDTHTVNTETAYKLAQTNTAIHSTLAYSASGSETIYFGFRMWILRRKGQLAEITGSTPTSAFWRSADGNGIQNTTFNIPKTQLQIGFDALKVAVYVKFGAGGWQLACTFITERLVKSAIEEGEYTFALWTSRLVSGGYTWATIRFGNNLYPSGLSLELQEPSSYELMQYKLLSGDLVGAILTPYISVIGNLFYGLLMLLICVPLYNRYRSLTPILLLFIIFGGAGGIFSLLVPEAGLGLAWIFLLFGLAGLLYKVFR